MGKLVLLHRFALSHSFQETTDVKWGLTVLYSLLKDLGFFEGGAWTFCLIVVLLLRWLEFCAPQITHWYPFTPFGVMFPTL